MPASDLRADIESMLLDKISASRYPSLELMNRFEAVVSDIDHARDYVHGLLDKVHQDQYPSLQLLDRITAMIERIERAMLAQQLREGQPDSGG